MNILMPALSGYTRGIVIGTNGALAGISVIPAFGSVAGGGSLSPFKLFTGPVVGGIVTLVGSYDFRLDLASSGLAQNYFRSVTVQDRTGVFRTYLTSAATFVAGDNTWTWGAGADPVWIPGDAGVTRRFMAYW